MNCKTAQRHMALAVGEDLGPAESQDLQGHLQGCSKCQKTWEHQRHGFAVLQRSRTQEVRRKSDSVWPVLANRLRERDSDSPRPEFNGWFAALAVTSACVLVFVFSQDKVTPIASLPQPGSPSDSMMISSPAEMRKITVPRPPKDGARTQRDYNAAPQPSADRP